MKQLLLVLFSITIITACSDGEENQDGLVGEWSGTTERLNSDGVLADTEVTCVIEVESGNQREVSISLSGLNYTFYATEEMDVLSYKDSQVGADSTIMTYITGSAELVNDTILRFDHEVYTKKAGAVLSSYDEMYDLVRE